MILDDVDDFLARFVAYPSDEARRAHVLWIAHTHLMDVWESTPRIGFLSPEPGSGKTRALEITEMLVPRPIEAVNATPAYLFRKVSDPAGLPTILYDEIDTVFGPRAKDNEEIRGILNAGHRRGAMAGRCVVRGKTVETEELPAYCAVAMAGLGNLPDTILTRSVVVRMRRRAPDEVVEPYRRRVHGPEGDDLRFRLEAWCVDITEVVTDVWPVMPERIEDRNADVWEPLLAIADAACGHWPETARVAAVALVALSKEGTGSLGVQLLKDLRRVFGDREKMHIVDILEALNGLPEAPWNELRGGPLTDRYLAKLLAQYDVGPRDVRIGTVTKRGYYRGDLFDPWRRYLSRPPEITDTDNGLPDTSSDVALVVCGDGDSSRGFLPTSSSPVQPHTSATSATPATETTLTPHLEPTSTCPRCDGEGDCDYCEPVRVGESHD